MLVSDKAQALYYRFNAQSVTFIDGNQAGVSPFSGDRQPPAGEPVRVLRVLSRDHPAWG